MVTTSVVWFLFCKITSSVGTNLRTSNSSSSTFYNLIEHFILFGSSCSPFKTLDFHFFKNIIVQV